MFVAIEQRNVPGKRYAKPCVRLIRGNGVMAIKHFHVEGKAGGQRPEPTGVILNWVRCDERHPDFTVR